MAIESTLDSLSLAYSSVRTENETLKGTVNSSAALVRQKEMMIADIRTATAKDVETLRQQVEALNRAKIEYETIIASLRAENSQLKGDNARLNSENSQSKAKKQSYRGSWKAWAGNWKSKSAKPSRLCSRPLLFGWKQSAATTKSPPKRAGYASWR